MSMVSTGHAIGESALHEICIRQDMKLAFESSTISGPSVIELGIQRVRGSATQGVTR
jgi:hypothetical protein